MNFFRGVPSFFRRIKRKKCSVFFPQGVSIIFMLNELTESHEDRCSSLQSNPGS